MTIFGGVVIYLALFGAVAGPLVKILMNFRIEVVDATHCRLTTETRVFTAGPQVIRGFATYWRMIYPGSALIRRMWLRAIKLRAETSSNAAPASATSPRTPANVREPG